jgi:hypothetical protein
MKRSFLVRDHFHPIEADHYQLGCKEHIPPAGGLFI